MSALTAHAVATLALPLHVSREDRLSVFASDFLIPKRGDHFQVLCSRIFYY